MADVNGMRIPKTPWAWWLVFLGALPFMRGLAGFSVYRDGQMVRDQSPYGMLVGFAAGLIFSVLLLGISYGLRCAYRRSEGNNWFTRIFGPKQTAIKFFLAAGIIILMGEARAEEFSLMSLVGYGMILPAFLMLGADGK